MQRHIYDCQQGCPVESTLQIISGKWKSVIIYHLLDGTKRFNDLEKLMSDCSRRMLSLQLKELLADGVISKEVFPSVPVKTTYSLTEFGRTSSRSSHRWNSGGSCTISFIEAKHRFRKCKSSDLLANELKIK